MTYDECLAIAMSAFIAVMDRDFGNIQFIYLECEVVDNGISADNDAGLRLAGPRETGQRQSCDL